MNLCGRERKDCSHGESVGVCATIFYYEQQIKRELQGIHIYVCRSNERLIKAKTDGSTLLTYTVLLKVLVQKTSRMSYTLRYVSLTDLVRLCQFGL